MTTEKNSARSEPSRAPVDLVFVIDTTGSMSDKIDGLIATSTQFVDEFASLGLDHRVAIVAFGDLKVPGDKIMATGFTNKIAITKKSLKDVPRYGGGGNEGESSLEALQAAMKLPFRTNAVKTLILITDEPAHQHGEVTGMNVLNRMMKAEFLVFVVSPPLSYFQEFAHKNSGRWYRVSAESDFTELVELFRQIAKRVSKVAEEVHRLAGGSVAKYRLLKPPSD